jgi:hypothetical protein
MNTIDLIETPESVTLHLESHLRVPWRLVATAKNLKGGDASKPWPVLVCARCDAAFNLMSFLRIGDDGVGRQHTNCLNCDPHPRVDMHLGPNGKLDMRWERFNDGRGGPILFLMKWRVYGRKRDDGGRDGPVRDEMKHVASDKFEFRRMTLGQPDVVRWQPYPQRDHAAPYAAIEKSPAAARARRSRA